MRKYFIGLLLMLTGCAYFEDNRVLYEKKVFGNIKLFRDVNMPDVDLVIAPNEEMMMTIVGNCNLVRVDTVNAKIIVSAGEYGNVLYEVHVFDKFGHNLVGSFQEERIDEKRFDSLSKGTVLIYTRPKEEIQ